MNPLDVMNDHKIIKKYRLDRDAILEICAQTQQHLVRPTSRSQLLPVSLQVLVALQYYATGSFQSVLADELDLQNTWLLGDSAYLLRKYLLKPLPTANTEAERRYNVAHKHTRCLIERTFGIWKMRFRCLHKSGGYMTYTPVKCAKIITAVAVLHNICVSRNLPFIDDNDDRVDDNDNDNKGDDNDGNDGENNNEDGRQTRNNLIRETFSS
ncbi:putative nuclease HARBI1 [Mya arenaria]|uniref:putative nuclease HARBI1 n=1 Tax=Mya arenaria TaxID=6604 RepID=UPI0022E5C2F1|nr:putative nuclease HARBI1 [Mya arenaria]